MTTVAMSLLFFFLALFHVVAASSAKRVFLFCLYLSLPLQSRALLWLYMHVLYTRNEKWGFVFFCLIRSFLLINLGISPLIEDNYSSEFLVKSTHAWVGCRSTSRTYVHVHKSIYNWYSSLGWEFSSCSMEMLKLLIAKHFREKKGLVSVFNINVFSIVSHVKMDTSYSHNWYIYTHIYMR